MKKYRIVYNGLNYRIQWLGKTFFLRRLKWYWLRYTDYAGDNWIAEFDSREAAHKAIIDHKIRVYAKKQGYKPIPAAGEK